MLFSSNPTNLICSTADVPGDVPDPHYGLDCLPLRHFHPDLCSQDQITTFHRADPRDDPRDNTTTT